MFKIFSAPLRLGGYSFLSPQRRRGAIGKMLLGHGFLWSDLLCYAVGVVMGTVIALMVERGRK